MQRLSSVLGMPQHRFASIHVVGTNGKSSVTLMIAALLEAHGVRAGAHTSPHLRSWAERVQVAGETIGDDDFAAAVERTAGAVEVVNRALDEGEAVTQFEAATAAAFVALAAAKVEVGVIEAGLGGRLDATNTIPSKLAVLTSVGLDHTQWLGETEAEIAVEKLAVLRDHTTLVAGELSGEVFDLARRSAEERHARFVTPPPSGVRSCNTTSPEVRTGKTTLEMSYCRDLTPGYQRRNFVLACAAAEAFLGRHLDEDAVAAVAANLTIPGRLEFIEGDPPLLLDAAHNPDGARALAEALPVVAAGRPVVAVLAILADKDARGIVAALAPACEAIVCTEIPAERLRGSGRGGATPFPAADLAALAAAEGTAAAEALASPSAAVARGRELAAERGGVLLLTGSHYLLKD